MDALLVLRGRIEIAHYRAGQLIATHQISNATQEALAVAVADGLSDGTCSHINYLQLELKTSGGGSSGSNNQKPMTTTTNAKTASGHSIGAYACLSTATITINDTITSSGTYNDVKELAVGYVSDVSNPHSTFTAYAKHTLSTAIVVESGDKVAVSWYVGSNNGLGNVGSEAVAEMLVDGTTALHPNQVGYQTDASDRVYVGTNATTGTGTVGGTDYKSAIYTTAQFTGGQSATPAKTNAYGLFARSGLFYADGNDEDDSSKTFNIASGTNYILKGIVKVTWG